MGRKHSARFEKKSVGGPGVPAGYQRIARASQMLDMPTGLVVKGLHGGHVRKKMIEGNVYVRIDDVIAFAERGVRLGLFDSISEKAKRVKSMNEAFADNR